jgi:hypothetical protein
MVGAGCRVDKWEGTAITADVLRLARRIQQSNQPTIGLLPLHRKLSLTLLARAAAQALASLGDQVAVLSPAWRDTKVPPRSPPIVHNPASTWTEVRLPGPPSARPSLDLEFATEWLRPRYQRVIVEIGFARPAAQASLLATLDGVLVASQPGRASEFQLAELAHWLTPGQRLGVLLID